VRFLLARDGGWGKASNEPAMNVKRGNNNGDRRLYLTQSNNDCMKKAFLEKKLKRGKQAENPRSLEWQMRRENWNLSVYSQQRRKMFGENMLRAITLNICPEEG